MALALALALAVLVPDVDAEVVVVERGELGAAPPAEIRAWMSLDVVVLADSGWVPGKIEPLVERTAEILGQCGLAISDTDWRLLRVPADRRDFSRANAGYLIGRIELRRPAAFLVRDTRQRPAFDAEAIGLGNSRTRPHLRNTVWLTRALPHPDIGLAHELAHVLMNSGAHVDRPGNLMQDRSAPGNRRLDADQCAELLDRGMANGLLRKTSAVTP